MTADIIPFPRAEHAVARGPQLLDASALPNAVERACGAAPWRSKAALKRLMHDALNVPRGHVTGDDARATLREWGMDVEPPAAPLLRIV